MNRPDMLSPFDRGWQNFFSGLTTSRWLASAMFDGWEEVKWDEHSQFEVFRKEHFLAVIYMGAEAYVEVRNTETSRSIRVSGKYSWEQLEQAFAAPETTTPVERSQFRFLNR